MTYKTVFAVRNGVIDSCMSVEWTTITADSIKTLAKIRGEKEDAVLKMLDPKVHAFCSNYNALMLRARYNMMDVYQIETEEKPSDEDLLAYHVAQRRKTERRKQ